ncbi:hypothetical protein K438DRAFT_1981689 [Mycena galopus ATCC 62051]|nr:hypothetical protein K438DRAFT_1981689 [Mycena galopus ATCC 62051]
MLSSPCLDGRDIATTAILRYPTVTSPRNNPIDFTGTGLEYNPGDSTVQSSPPSQQPMSISATPWPESARVYTQKGNGLIRQAVLGGSSWDEVSRRWSLKRHADTLAVTCAPWSHICSLSWGRARGDKLATIFYQTGDNAIHEMRIDAQDKWNVSSFTQSDAMPETAIAAVQSKDADRFMIFFQDKDGFLCYRRAIKWVWDAAVRMCKAGTNTPIAATAWSENAWAGDANHVHLYFQDTKNQLRELYTTPDGSWAEKWSVRRTLKIPQLRSTGSMGVFSWQGPRILIYAQGQDNKIHQISCGANFEYVDTVLDTGPNPVLPNTGVAAFATQPDSRTLYGRVYWANVDKLLQEKDVADGVWHPATIIAT